MARSALGSDNFPTLGNIDSSKWTYVRDTAWTTTPPQVVTGNFLVGSAQGESVFNMVRWTESGDVFTDDQYVTFTLGGLAWEGGGHFVGPAVRVSADTNTNADAYYLKIRDDGASGASHEWQLFKMVNGTETAIDTRSRTTTNGDTIALEAVGTSLLVYHNSTLVYTITGQTDLTSGNAGLILSGNGVVTNVSIDTVEVGNITSGSDDLFGQACL